MTEVVRWRPVDTADATLLTPTERNRRDRLHHHEDRAAYVAAHVLVRECAAALLEVDVATVLVEQRCPECGGTDHGRPFLPAHPGVAVSLSHTRSHVAAIAVRAAACGIDVEDPPGTGIPWSSLSPGEQAEIELADHPDLAFLALWTRREALVKAGIGTLDRPGDPALAEVSTSPGPPTVSWAVVGRSSPAAP